MLRGVRRIYIAKIKMCEKEFKGTLDFYTMIKILEDLKERGFDYTVIDIFKSISDIANINMYVVSSIVLNSILRVQNITEEEIVNTFIKAIKEDDGFFNVFKYINTIFDKCMPEIKQVKDALEFEFEEEHKEDWDFAYMEYLWNSIIKRTDDFYSITPKNFFKQLDIYKDMNNIKDAKKEANTEYL